MSAIPARATPAPGYSHDPPPARTLRRLLLVLALVVAPHAMHMPPWITALAVLLGIWRTMATYRAWRRPPAWLRVILALAGFGGVWATFGHINGRDAGVALLVLMVAFKLTEADTRRDAIILLFLGYFVLITHFLFDQSIAMAAFLLIGVWLLTACLIDVNHQPHALPARTALWTALTIECQALPLMVILFVLFPRIPGPLWSLPPAGASARTGLSDYMTPGSVSHLALSDAVAFRVRFEGPPPPPQARYWRGPVFSRFDGRTWRAPPSETAIPPVVTSPADEITYEVTLEPNDRHWLLALDMPVSRPADAWITGAGNLRTNRPVDERRLYRVRSALSYHLQPAGLGPSERHQDLFLPDGAAPGTQALVAHWRASGLHGMALAQRALRFFHDQPFVYTLQPPPLPGPAPVDAFVFDTRRGFCEHFAGAFTVMMRAGGIPARVVTGYQGGEMNDAGGYLIVRQSDAHAWSEIWLSGRGWVRVDPTAAVAPERVELGLGAALPADALVPLMARRGDSWIHALRLRWDWMNTVWDRAVLAYGPSLQQSFLARFGLPDTGRMLLALTFAVTGFLSVIGLILVLRTGAPRESDPVLRAWHRVTHRLARIGLAPAATEGPQHYAERIAAARPDLATDIHALVERYVSIRYGGRNGRAAIAAFIQRARRFRPRRRR